MKKRYFGTVSRGVRAPIISEGDDIVSVVADSVLNAAKGDCIPIRDRDIIGVTEAVVARAQGNYATVEQIAGDIAAKFPEGELGIVFPILSRNRFSVCLKGIAAGVGKLTILLSYPADEVGNHLLSIEDIDEAGINSFSDTITEEEYRRLFGYRPHRFTGVDYIEYYRSLSEEAGAEVEIVLANDERRILDYTKYVLCCDIHSRERSKRRIKEAGGDGVRVLGLDDILTSSFEGSGFNSRYGLLGSNKATETSVKLFPQDCASVVSGIRERIMEATGRKVEVIIYGDGAFKDPVGRIWELADPVVAPGYTEGLEGQPSEVKLKYLADNDFSHLKGEELSIAISEYIKRKDSGEADSEAAIGTTPRRLADLVGSLCDLTSGSGDKGTPIVWIQGYFDNYTSE